MMNKMMLSALMLTLGLSQLPTIALAQSDMGSNSNANTSTTTTSTASTPSASLSAMDKMFMMKAAQGGHAEIMSSKEALKNSQSTRVHKIATDMIHDHKQADQALSKIAAETNYTLPTETDAKHKQVGMKLSSLSGKSFDKLYLSTQKKDHAATIALFNKEISQGTNPDLKQFATNFLPIIKDHYALISDAKANMTMTSKK